MYRAKSIFLFKLPIRNFIRKLIEPNIIVSGVNPTLFQYSYVSIDSLCLCRGRYRYRYRFFLLLSNVAIRGTLEV